MSKGQMEIFGLVVIVILVTLGLLFAVVVLTKKPVYTVQEIKENIQAANFLNTMLGTTSQSCNKRSVRELVQDCALASVENGEWIGASMCEDKNTTCQKANETIATLLDLTFGKWGRDYRLFFNGSDAAGLLHAERGACKGNREGSTRPEIVRPGFSINVTLHLCQS